MISRRLRPLYLAVALQGSMLWVPVEKLFMSQIGFDAQLLLNQYFTNNFPIV